MKLFERKLGKKVVVLTGAMILSLAMATAAYAGTAEGENQKMKDLKPVDSIAATLCVEAVSVDGTEIDLPEGVVKMEKIDLSHMKGVTKAVEATKAMVITDMTDLTDVDMTDMENVTITKIDDKDSTDASKIIVKAIKMEK